MAVSMSRTVQWRHVFASPNGSLTLGYRRPCLSPMRRVIQKMDNRLKPPCDTCCAKRPLRRIGQGTAAVDPALYAIYREATGFIPALAVFREAI